MSPGLGHSQVVGDLTEPWGEAGFQRVDAGLLETPGEGARTWHRMWSAPSRRHLGRGKREPGGRVGPGLARLWFRRESHWGGRGQRQRWEEITKRSRGSESGTGLLQRGFPTLVAEGLRGRGLEGKLLKLQVQQRLLKENAGDIRGQHQSERSKGRGRQSPCFPWRHQASERFRTG